ncbi:hypothetical protein ACLB2K_039933 [Fragaria x ananassa]
MGVFTYETEFTSVIPPPRLFKAFILDADNLIPKIAPQAVKCAEIIEGDGGVGTIKKITFGEGSQFGSVTHKIDGIDKENFVYSYSLVEGDALSDKIEKISYETKLVASSDGGSIIKSTSNYHTKGDVEIKEEHVKAGKEKASHLFKLVEGYLLANPNEYWTPNGKKNWTQQNSLRVGQKMVLINDLEQASGLFFSGLDMLFLDLNLTLAMVVAGALDDGASTWRRHQLDLVRDFLNLVSDSITFNDTVVVNKVVFVKSINLVFHVAVFASFTEVDLLDGSNTSITLNDLGALHSLWGNLWDEVISIKDKGLVESWWWDDRGDVEIKEEHVKAGKEKAFHLFKLVESYLLANPNEPGQLEHKP